MLVERGPVAGGRGDWWYVGGKTASEFSSRQQRPPHWGRGAHPPHPGRQHLHFYSLVMEGVTQLSLDKLRPQPTLNAFARLTVTQLGFWVGS